MPKKSSDTRTSIMDAAQEQILEKGYGGTSIDAILAQTGVTKGSFFHHFPSKEDLAFAIIERYADSDRATLQQFKERAARISKDPLHRIQLVIAFYQDHVSELIDPTKGCIYAAYGYQPGLFGEQTRGVITESFDHWLEVLEVMFQDAIDVHPIRMDVTARDLAMAALTTIQGGLTLSKNLGDADLLSRQLRQFRNYVELLFDEG